MKRAWIDHSPNNMAKILLAEDDYALCTMLENLMHDQNHQLDVANDGQYALELLQEYQYDLAILDCDLPKLPGFEICRQYRLSGGKIPVLFLTGRTDPGSRVSGLDLGADDYMCKPFNAPELLARIRALLRRSQKDIEQIFKVGKIAYDPLKKEVLFDGKPLSLVRKEMLILELFLRNPEVVFSADAILDRVWSSESEVSPDTVRPYMKKLRDKLTDSDGKCQLVTVHGYGYKLKVAAD